MKIIWHGTASIELINKQGRILFDPFVPLRHSTVPVRIEEFDGFTDVFITHGHFDHILDIPEIVRRNPDVRLYCTKTPCQSLCKKGVPKNNLTQLSFGQSMEVKGFRILALHGKHAVLPYRSLSRLAYILKSPARGNIPYILKQLFMFRENDETIFYQIESEGSRISLMGSLNLRDDVTYPAGADVLILPYNGWDDNYPPAVRAIERLRPKRVLLDHFDDTFPPLTSPLNLRPILYYKNHKDIEIRALELHRITEV